MTRALCIDLGGTNLRGGIFEDGSSQPIVALGRWPAPRSLSAFQEAISLLIARSEAVNVGIALPGLVSGTRSLWIPNLPYLDGVDLEELFPTVKLVIGHDAQLALLAETVRGSARGHTDALLIAIGTGIGSAVLGDGRIIRGFHGAATSFGWASVQTNDPGDASHGWLERKVSGRALDKLAVQTGFENGVGLLQRARGGDPTAIQVLEEPSAAFGTALAGAVALLGSQIVIVTGGVSDGLDVIRPRALETLRRNVPPHLRRIEMVCGEMQSGASLAGAGLAACGHTLWRKG